MLPFSWGRWEINGVLGCHVRIVVMMQRGCIVKSEAVVKISWLPRDLQTRAQGVRVVPAAPCCR